ncbi:hypothetical protein FRB99_002618 [Tulasnella sp. 403]|nr:hypothetical protein FRB99_002618 [Tulasnella sp. 403]
MDPTSCTQQRRKILFVGDSHGRVAFDGVIHRLEGNENILTRSAKAGTKMAKVGNLESTFAWDPRGATIHPRNCSILEGVDVLVTSVGAHWATNESTKKYLDVMQGILQTVENCPSTPSKLIFLTAPAQPPRQDHYVRENNDHRTNVRLQYWAEHTTDLALAAGWNVVDQFAYSQHMAIEPMYLDFAHYLSTDALDPIVDEIIGKSGLCPDV